MSTVSMLPSLVLFLTQFILLSGLFIHVLSSYTAIKIAPPSHPTFIDVSTATGLSRPLGPRIKYGGACVADLNGDGYVDLLFGHHDARWSEAYFFNPANKTFSKSNWAIWVDGHGYTSFRAAPWQETLHFIVTRGGQRNSKPNAPELFRVYMKRSTKGTAITTVNTISPVALSSDAEKLARGRGRSALVVNLRRRVKRPDIIMLNAPRRGVTPFSNTLYSIHGDNTMVFKNVSSSTWHGFSKDPNFYALATDINSDGRMEIITFQELKVYKRVRDYTLQDVSDKVLPQVERRGTIAVAEADFNNDGLWDLYVARTARGELQWLRHILKNNADDMVLWNDRGTRYVLRQNVLPDEVKHASFSHGVTVADFNNDGWVDVFVPQYDNEGVDYILLNLGGSRNRERNSNDKWFVAVKASSLGIHRNYPRRVVGDQGVAVDYDLDGRVDIIASQGDWFDSTKAGFYRIFRNTIPLHTSTHAMEKNNFILVRVGNAPARRCTAIHATVEVCVDTVHIVDRFIFGVDKKWTCMNRRVGTSGKAVSDSFLETLHFGIGRAKRVQRIKATWIDGSTEKRYSVIGNQVVKMGVQ